MSILDTMTVHRETDNILYTVIDVTPWPDEPWAAKVTVVQEKRDPATGKDTNVVRVRYGQSHVLPQTAYEYAMAILRAVDIAKQLERDGAIILEGEIREPPACEECGMVHAPHTNSLCSR